MEFLRNIFTEFIFEKLLSPEALMTGRVKLLATTYTNNQTQLCKEL